MTSSLILMFLIPSFPVLRLVIIHLQINNTSKHFSSPKTFLLKQELL